MNEEGFRHASLWETAGFARGQRIGAAAGVGTSKHPEMMRASVQRVSLSRISNVALGRPSLVRASGVQVGPSRFTGGVPGVGGERGPACLGGAGAGRGGAGWGPPGA